MSVSVRVRLHKPSCKHAEIGGPINAKTLLIEDVSNDAEQRRYGRPRALAQGFGMGWQAWFGDKPSAKTRRQAGNSSRVDMANRFGDRIAFEHELVDEALGAVDQAPCVRRLQIRSLFQAPDERLSILREIF